MGTMILDQGSSLALRSINIPLFLFKHFIKLESRQLPCGVRI